jgi:hypothetical protein
MQSVTGMLCGGFCAIPFFSDDGMSEMGKMDTDLMGTARVQGRTHKRMTLRATYDTK